MVWEAGGSAGEKAVVLSRKAMIRLAVVATLVVLVVAAALALGLPRALSLDNLRTQRTALVGVVQAHPVAGIAIYCAAYVALVALSLPGALVMSLAGGFLFGAIEGTAAAAASVTLGSTLMFFVARTALGASLARRFGGRSGVIGRIEAAAGRHPFSTILTARLIPAIPIFVVNLGAGAVRMAFAPFLLATAIGVIPSMFLYASVGSGLDHLFDTVEPGALMGVIRSELALPALGLCCLAVLPLALQWLKSRRVAERQRVR